MKTTVAAAVSLLVGLGLGWLAFHGEPVVQNVATRTVERVEVPVVGKTVVIEATPKPQAIVASPLAQPPPSTPAQTGGATAPEAEVVTLRARVNELQTALEIEQKLRKGTEGEKVPVPAGLPPRLRDEKLLVASFNAALKEAGFPGQVSSVDCSEHPCIVFGNGFGERGDMEKLLPTSGFSQFAKDSMSTFGFQRGPDTQDPASRFFGVAVMPPGDDASPGNQEAHRLPRAPDGRGLAAAGEEVTLITRVIGERVAPSRGWRRCPAAGWPRPPPARPPDQLAVERGVLRRAAHAQLEPRRRHAAGRRRASLPRNHCARPRVQFTGREWRTIETDATTWQACDTARSYALKTYERIHRERGHAVALDLEEAD